MTAAKKVTWALYDEAGKMVAEDWDVSVTGAAHRAIEMATALIIREQRPAPARVYLPMWRYTVYSSAGNAVRGHSDRPCG